MKKIENNISSIFIHELRLFASFLLISAFSDIDSQNSLLQFAGTGTTFNTVSQIIVPSSTPLPSSRQLPNTCETLPTTVVSAGVQ